MTVADALRGARDHWHLRVLKKRLADNYTAPVIITGMHRSGTSLVSRLLRGHGVYLGNVLDANSEAVEFLAMNDQVLLQLGSTWQAPASDMDLLDPDTRRRLTRFVVRHWHALRWHFFESFGIDAPEEENYKRVPTRTTPNVFPPLGLSLAHRAVAWGWKDPRNTLTLPVWLELFPEAKVLHVVRNGVDCADSLWRRANESGVGAPDCLDLAYCFRLWERYVAEGLKARTRGSDRYRELRYESLLESPHETMESLVRYVGVASQAPVDSLKHIDPTRVRRRDCPALAALRVQARESTLFQQLGYVDRPDGAANASPPADRRTGQL